jgi:hypothetical protein
LLFSLPFSPSIRYSRGIHTHDEGMEESMQSISDGAKKLGVSRQSVYNRLDRAELAGHVHDRENGKCLDNEGIEILKGLYPVRADSQNRVNGQSGNCQNSVNGQASDNYADSYMKSLETERDFLRSMLTEKDKQIAEKDKQLFELASAIRMREEQGKAQLMIEASSQVPQEVTNIPQAAPKGGFFSRVFRK